MWSLLDADQDIPWTDQPLVFHHKYRFWVQPFDASYHTQLDLGERDMNVDKLIDVLARQASPWRALWALANRSQRTAYGAGASGTAETAHLETLEPAQAGGEANEDAAGANGGSAGALRSTDESTADSR